MNLSGYTLAVSIHASAKEATGYTVEAAKEIMFQSTPPRRRRPMPFDFFESRKRSFNPRLREGGDFLLSSSVYHLHGFNPRLREGGDNHRGVLQKGSHGFNPRLREGGDYFSLNLVGSSGSVSIHASAREATVIPHRPPLL